ncbi:MAG: hypothetical protein FWE42_08405 [Defluviitaleaceae bacterium]|nr:hypothetical protein [Defluviitaleaceae bacterium]
MFIGGNVELAWQIYANQGGFFDACQEGKLEKANAEWRKSDRQSDIEPYEHSFLMHASRHCEKRSDEAIQPFHNFWIASLHSQ